jgi:hypothetical protein
MVISWVDVDARSVFRHGDGGSSCKPRALWSLVGDVWWTDAIA